MGKPENKGIMRVVRAARYSTKGVIAAFQHESAFRQELALCAILIPLGIWLGESAIERVLLVGVCLLLLMMELLNSAVEAIVDRVGTDHHPLSGQSKDMASAAVAIALVLIAMTWGLILVPRLFA